MGRSNKPGEFTSPLFFIFKGEIGMARLILWVICVLSILSILMGKEGGDYAHAYTLFVATISALAICEAIDGRK